MLCRNEGCAQGIPAAVLQQINRFNNKKSGQPKAGYPDFHFFKLQSVDLRITEWENSEHYLTEYVVLVNHTDHCRTAVSRA